MKDRRLVHRLSRADPDALRQIYHWYKDDLPTVAMALLADPDGAEDCMPDEFVHFGGFYSYGSPLSRRRRPGGACSSTPPASKAEKLSLFHSVSSSLDQNRRHE